jgi:heme A synthase
MQESDDENLKSPKVVQIWTAMQQTRRTRITANIVGLMIFVQVILGGSATILSNAYVLYHLIWGTLTFVMLVVTTILAVKDFGTGSTLVRVAIAAIIDFVIQGVLGLFSFGAGVPLVVHLTNGFLLAVIITYLISFADSADKASLSLPSKIPTTPGTMSS